MVQNSSSLAEMPVSIHENNWENVLMNMDFENQDSVVGSVIHASGMVVFEDVLRTVAWWPDIKSAARVCTSPVVNLAP